MDKNHIMDSCRYDSLVAASTPNSDRVGRRKALFPRLVDGTVALRSRELFGEDGYSGHGPIMHEKCFEIPYVEGKLNEAVPVA